MAKTKISEYSSTSADNTDISNINIAEGCSPANVNNAIRTLMAQIKDLQAGTSGDTIPLTAGGTGSTTASTARTALSAAKLGANSDITSITGLTTPLTTAQGGTGTASTTFANLTTNVTGTLPVTNGGTGLATLTANNVMLGNGTSSPSFVAPSTSGNVLTSNGTTWNSSALSSLSAFDKSLTANGYQKLPSGLIMQWGESASVNQDSSVSVTFPIVFPSACVSVVITGNRSMATTGQGIQTVQSVSTTGFQINNGQDSTLTFYWLAMGY